MSDATNDTTPRTASAEMAKQIVIGILTDLHGRVGLGEEWDTIEPDMQLSIIHRWNSITARWIEPLIADLDRLGGPVCEHDGKRAIDHLDQWLDFGGANYGLVPHYHTYNCFDEGRLICNRAHDVPHPDSPIIEAWLRERGK